MSFQGEVLCRGQEVGGEPGDERLKTRTAVGERQATGAKSDNRSAKSEHERQVSTVLGGTKEARKGGRDFGLREE